MIEVDESGGSEKLVYDGLGQRVKKTLASGETAYVYDAFGQLAAEYTTVPTTSAPCTTCYLSTDHLGSTRLVTDQSGNIVARHDFLPFGEEIPGGTAGRNSSWGSTIDVTQKFTGQVRDSETGMDFFNARYFGAALGRFTSVDPGNAGADMYNPQSWNGYGYVANNPLNATDPSGMFGERTPEDAYQVLWTSGYFGPVHSFSGMYGGYAPSHTSSAGGGQQQPQVTQNQVAPPNNQSPLPPQIQACDSAILNAVNTKFKTSFTDTNVTRRFQFSTGAPDGQGTLNLNISVSAAMQPTKVAVGRYPVNPATYVLGAGATLHIPLGPGGADSPLTLPFNASQFTAHLDSALPYNPIGFLTHLLQDMSSLGGYKPCP